MDEPFIEKPPKSQEEIEKERQERTDAIFPEVSAEAVETAVKEAMRRGYRKGIKVARVNNPMKYEEGEVISLNESNKGAWPGDKYPIEVKFPSTEKILRFGVSELKIIENKNAAS